MKTAFLSAALLFAFSAQLPALTAVHPVHPVHHLWELAPQVIKTRRVGAAVVAVLNPTHIIIHLDEKMGAVDKGELLLTTYEPMRQHFFYAQAVGFEAATLLYISGRKGVAFDLVPQVGYEWQVPIKSVHPWRQVSM